MALAQNVGIGVPNPSHKLHVDGSLRLDGDTLTGNLAAPATILHLVSNGGVSVKLDANDDGSERFTVKRSGPDLGSVVFEVTEAGHTTASGFGDLNGYGRFNGDLTLSGDSRNLLTGENFDVEAAGSVEIYLDTDADNASSDFSVLDDAGQVLFCVEETRNPTVYPSGVGPGETGGIRLRELRASGSNFIGLRAPDALSSNVWLTLPNTDGLPGQFLQTDGTGLLSWAFPPTPRAGEGGMVEREFSLGSGDSVRVGLGEGRLCGIRGQWVEQGAGAGQWGCGLSPPADPSAGWQLRAVCRGSCERLRCNVSCSP